MFHFNGKGSLSNLMDRRDSPDQVVSKILEISTMSLPIYIYIID
jgi:hypothetical protein